MNEDYKELIEYLDKKFGKTDKQFECLDKKVNKIEKDLENKADKETANKILASQDNIVTKLDKLLQEKTFSDEQDKRKTKVLEIHNDALKRDKILSKQESVEVDRLRAF